MPLFSLEELETIKRTSISSNCSYFTWLIFGGSARNFVRGVPATKTSILPVVNDAMEYFFKDTTYKKDFPEAWSKALMILSEDFMIEGEYSMNVINSIMLHRLENHQMIWASKFMAYLAGVILDDNETSLRNLLQSVLGRKVGDVVFESLAHRQLTSSKKPFKILERFKKFSPKTPNYKEVVNFNLPVALIRSIDDVAFLKEGFYGLPVFENFPLVDAIIQPNILIQFTNSPEYHKGAANKLSEIRSLLLERNQTNHKMIFVIPVENVQTFKYQSDLNIPQFITVNQQVTSVKGLMNSDQLEKYKGK